MVKGRVIDIAAQQEILTLREEGYSVKEIMGRCNVSQRSVYRILQRGQLMHNRMYPNGAGRPKLLTDRDKRRIKKN